MKPANTLQTQWKPGAIPGSNAETPEPRRGVGAWLRNFFLCPPHREEVARLRAEVRELRRHERRLWEALTRAEDWGRRLKIELDATNQFVAAILDDGRVAVITPVPVSARGLVRRGS